MYQRVFPRDLFNEAKFLKGLGRLTMLIEDELCPLTYDYDRRHAVFPPDDTMYEVGLLVDQRPSDGGLECKNLKFFDDGKLVKIYSMLNCRSPYNLVAESPEVGEIEVFNDDGSLTDEFKIEIGMGTDE